MVRHLRRMQAPINSIKHYVHRTNTAVASGALQTNVVAESVVAPATANAFSVKEASILKAVFIEVWLQNGLATGSTTQFILIVEKLPGNSVGMTAAQALNLGAYPNKKNILYVTQGNLTAQGVGGNSVSIIRNWVMIPKGKQRMGLDDQILVHIAPVGQTINVCGIFTYKEYT